MSYLHDSNFDTFLEIGRSHVMEGKMIKGIVFDFDGTLVDSENFVYEAIHDFLYQEYDYTYTREVYQLSIGQVEGNFIKDLERKVGREINQIKLNEAIKLAQSLGYRNLSLRPGIEDILMQSKQNGLKLGVVSNSSIEDLNFFFNYHSEVRKIFDTVITIEDVIKGKPAPDGYLSCISKLGITPEEVIAIEDSPIGASAALNAGISTMIYPNKLTEKLKFPAEGRIIDNVKELTSKLLCLNY